MTSSESNQDVSSYDIDVDEEAEQILRDRRVSPIGADNWLQVTEPVNGSSEGKVDALLKDVGLEGQLASVAEMPHKRPVSVNDIFCNREIKLGAIRAIGFDMDYTLAQYKQPMFDNLAFEGAKEKLVKALGYPEEVMDLEYDHTVRFYFLVNIFFSIFPLPLSSHSLLPFTSSSVLGTRSHY